jgi:hypothetical protein
LQVLSTARTATSNISKGRYFEAERLSSYICCVWFTGGGAKKNYPLARKYVNLYVLRVKEVILSKLFLISLRLGSELNWRI